MQRKGLREFSSLRCVLRACGSCQGINLGLPVSFYRDTQEKSLNPLSFSRLRQFHPLVQITELILGNLQLSFCLALFVQMGIMQQSAGSAQKGAQRCAVLLAAWAQPVEIG